MREPRMGETAKDNVTGFIGVVTGRFEYINGCVRFMLEKGKPDGSGIEELMFDRERLGVVEAAPVEVIAHDTGGPRDVPQRTSDRLMRQPFIGSETRDHH